MITPGLRVISARQFFGFPRWWRNDMAWGFSWLGVSLVYIKETG